MSPLDTWPLTRDSFLSGAPRSRLNTESLYICEPLHNKCWSMANRWLTCPALWIWICVMCWTLATVARSTEGGRGAREKKKKKRSSRVGKRDRGRQISFLHTETVKVSQKPVIKCIMCHVLVSHIGRDWKADRQLCALTTLSRASFPLFSFGR